MPPLPAKYWAVVRLRKQSLPVKEIAWRLDVSVEHVQECIAHYVLHRQVERQAAGVRGATHTKRQHEILAAVIRLHEQGANAKVLLANFGDLVELHPAEGWRLKRG